MYDAFLVFLKKVDCMRCFEMRYLYCTADDVQPNKGEGSESGRGDEKTFRVRIRMGSRPTSISFNHIFIDLQIYHNHTS